MGDPEGYRGVSDTCGDSDVSWDIGHATGVAGDFPYATKDQQPQGRPYC